VYEARMLASFVGDPERLTAPQMERWCKDFDNWAFCDAMSFNLFDRTPHAWTKVAQWSSRRNEFEKRTAFARTHESRCNEAPQTLTPSLPFISIVKSDSLRSHIVSAIV
jgi:3-methyladenine DNA glycosylase AlkD